MKIKLENNNYLKIEPLSDSSASITIKARKDQASIVLVTASLDSGAMDILISELISIRSKLKNV
jgi:hypothetical protein